MLNYEAPTVLLTGSGEGPFGGSGSFTTPDGPSATITWTNHNSGSHSDLEIKVNSGNMIGEYLSVTAIWQGKGNIISVGGYGGSYSTANFNNNVITFIRYGHINSNETFSLSFNNVVFDETGDDHDTSIHKGSYYDGEGRGYFGEAFEFKLDVNIV